MEQEWLLSFYVGIIFAYLCIEKKMLLKHFHSGLEQTLEDTIKMSHLFDTIRSMFPMFTH